MSSTTTPQNVNSLPFDKIGEVEYSSKHTRVTRKNEDSLTKSLGLGCIQFLRFFLFIAFISFFVFLVFLSRDVIATVLSTINWDVVRVICISPTFPVLVVLFLYRKAINDLLYFISDQIRIFFRGITSITIQGVTFKRAEIEQLLVDLEVLKIGIEIAKVDNDPAVAELRHLFDLVREMNLTRYKNNELLKSLEPHKRDHLIVQAIAMANADGTHKDIEYEYIVRLAGKVEMEKADLISFIRMAANEKAEHNSTDINRYLPTALQQYQ